MSTVRIRRATAGDIEAVCGLSNVINAEHHAAVPNEFLAAERFDRDAGFWLKAIAHRDTAILLAEADHTAVGLIAVTVKNLRGRPDLLFLADRLVAHIDTVVVAPDWRRRGIGRRLFEAASDHAREAAATEIRLDVMAFNEAAGRFYRELGFEPLSHTLARPLEPADR